MKKRFTRILAALALLVGLTIPMGVWGQTTTYEQLTSIANIDESAQYVLGIDGTGFHYSGTSSWGLVALPSAQTPIYYTLTKASDGNSFTAQATISNTSYYLQVPTSNTFSMATSAGTNTDLIIGTTQVSGTNYAVANKTTTARHLRINGASGLRSYAGTTGTMAFFYKVVNSSAPTHTVTYKPNGPVEDDLVYTYAEGDDVEVIANPFNYALHAFTKWNTSADGTGTDYQPSSTIQNIGDDYVLYAQWEDSDETVDILNREFTGVTSGSTTYSSWSGKESTSGAVYAGNSAGGNNSIQLRSQSPSGIVTTATGGKVTKIVVTWNSNTADGRTLTIYGKNSAYESSSDLYSESTRGTSLGTIVMGTSTELTISGDYSFIGLLANGPMYLSQIRITWVPDNDPAVATSVTIDASGITNTNVFEGTAAGSLSATVKDDENNPINGATVTWTSSNEEVATIAADGTVTLVAAGTTTITAAYAGVENQYRPSQGTYELTVTNEDPNAPGTANNPYTVAQAIAFIDDLNGATSEVVYVSGIISQVDEYFNNYHSITYWISDDGTTDTQLEVYSGKGLNGDDFSSIDDLQVNDIVTVKGNLKKYGDVYEFNYNSQITQFERPQSTEPSITVTPETVNLTSEQTGAFLTVAYENLADEPDFDVLFVDANGDEAEYDWLGIAYDNIESIELQAQANDGEARTAYVMVIGYDNEANMVQSNIVTVNQAAYVAPFAPTLYEKVTSTLDDFSGQYIIVGFNDNDAYAMAEQKANNRNAFIISEDGTYATVISDAVHELTIAKQGDYYTIYDGREGENNNKGYLYAAGGNGNNPKNYLKTETDLDENNNGLWAIGIDNEGNTSIVSKGNASRTIMRFNYNSGSPLFSCYGSGQQPVFLYKKSNEAPVNYTLTINGYTDDNSKAGYYLIASPVKVNPATVEGMTTGDYDLYYFDQTGGGENGDGKEWRNYEAQSFNLVPGKGYLYAKKATSQDPYSFTLTGVPYDGDGEIELTNTTGADFAGWNLVGNPFGEEAEISMDYYELNPTDTELIAGTDYVIDAMQGVFVKYSSTNTTVMFAPSDVVTPSHSNDANVVLNVTRNRGNVIDRAIVRFGEGSQLPKFQLNPNNTKIYVTEGNQDFAVVRSAAEADMPVSFKASENGTYTLAVEAENVEMNYLHLIDNMTGADVDLLATPSYSFEARTSDYANRFRLVFKANGTNENNAETFAYFNGTNWTVSNVGDATLQVVDVTGRMVSNETISGNATVSLNQPAGVYVIRLVNGDNVKTQKVVVR